MQEYIVCADIFKDLTNNHIYQKGDKFPFDKSEVDSKRIEELSTTNNKIGKILIREKTLKDFTKEELIKIAYEEKVLIEGEPSEEELIKTIAKNRSDISKVKEKLLEKGIEFDDNCSLDELKNLLKNEK